MRFFFLAALVGTLGVAAGCGDDKPAPPAENADGAKPGFSPAKGGSSGNQAQGGAGGEGGSGELVVDPLAPIVTVTSPEQLDDPNDGGVLIGTELDVSCLVKESVLAGSSKVNADSVKLALLGADGKVLGEKAGMPGEATGEYEATFSLTEVPTGRLVARCSAEDVDRRLGADTVSTYFDKGPTVTFTSPIADQFYPLSTLLVVDFTVEAAPLTDDDEGAAVKDVSLDAAGVKLDLTDAEVEPGHFRLELDLTDTKLFNPAPNGPLGLTVKASNERVEGQTSRVATIDGAGPTLQIIDPTDKKVVGGRVVVTFSALDPISGVEPDSVVVSLNMVEHHFDAGDDAWSFANGNYSYAFDSRQVENSNVQITVNLAASDKVGNSTTANSVLLYLDNHPPIVDLDPENIRTLSTDGKCSLSFDPVGAQSKNDLDNAANAGKFRALVWEQTNTDPDIDIQYYAGTVADSVRLYVRPASGPPLLIDKDGNGVCDDVNDVDSKAGVSLAPITEAGSPAYGVDALDAAKPPSMDGICVAQPGSPPTALCANQSSDMWYVLKHFTEGTETAIYAPSVSPGLACTGVDWELGGQLGKDDDGWVCLAARAVDKVGNVGVSRPLRLCVDRPGKPDNNAGPPPCAVSSTVPPSCTNNCTAPSRFPASIVDLR